jgi:hypothetical protein|tara:strand:+ start:264 stop:485 length:222 start_codon:yes stop_codon:yes gene_type:complete
MEQAWEVLGWFKDEAGLVAVVLVLTNVWSAFLLLRTDKDRKAAWRAHNTLVIESIKSLAELENALTLIAERLK